MKKNDDISPVDIIAEKAGAHTEDRLSLCVLASGSKGNSIYIQYGETAILFDAGLSGVEIERRMQHRRLSPKTLSAIVVSHEHADHVQGVGVLSRRYDIPVYSTAGTFDTVASQLGRIGVHHPFECGRPFSIKGLAIHPFSVSHDACDPAGFTIRANGKKIGIATDLGIATAMVREHLKSCDALILEANHDIPMLEQGPYPWPLKQRIKSRSGHLCNESAKALLMDVLHDQLAHVVLAHLSETNNTPEKALSVVTQRLDRHPVCFSVARQDACGKLIFIE